MPMRLALVLLAIVLAVPALSNATVLTTGNGLDLKIDSEHPVLQSPQGALVRGTISVMPSPIKPVCDRLVFYVDGEARLATDASSPRLVLDTTEMTEGEHVLRLEAERDGRLFVSSGAVSIRVGNEAGAAVLGEAIQVPEKAAPPFQKLYRTPITDEAIWFNGLEGDLEKSAFKKSGRLYVSLTDLLRHIGGQIIWGPKSSYVEVHRNDVTLRITPGSSKVLLNNNPVNIKYATVFRDGRTFVPARAICNLFDVYIEWSDAEKRAYVYTPQPGYGVEVRSYPWISPVTGNALALNPGQIVLRNYTGLPVHVLLQGNGFRLDYQIHAHRAIGPLPIPAGTYRTTVWSRQGEDFDTYLTIAPGANDRYDITHHTISLGAH